MPWLEEHKDLARGSLLTAGKYCDSFYRADARHESLAEFLNEVNDEWHG